METRTDYATIVVPTCLRYELLLTASTPISHHDPAVQDDSNCMLFNRQKQLLAGPFDVTMPSREQVEAILAAHQVPSDIADLFDDVSLPEFVATALTRIFLDLYNSNDGEGLFSGMERYARLEARLRQSAVRSQTLRGLWNRLCDAMQVSVHGGEHDEALWRVFALPAGFGSLVLRTLTTDYRSIVALARLWHTTEKRRNPDYAAKSGQPVAGPLVMVNWPEDRLAPHSDAAQVVEVPCVTGNSLRHQIVREPAWLHLCQHLGIAEATPGQGQIPSGCEAIFYNGGNIEAGAKQPSNVFSLAWRARENYPSLDLVGGVTDSFDLGESRLKVAGWLVCRENREALRGSPAYDLPAASISVFDMLDEVTLTRQASPHGEGQMIYTFETLAAGTQILCRLNLSPFTPLLTRGALVAAVDTFMANGANVGGQGSRGFGHCVGDWLTRPDDGDVRAQYEAYLTEHKDELRAWLCDGTLGTGVRILS